MCMIHVQLPDASLCACVMSLMIGDPPLHSFGNNHPCPTPSMTPWSLSLSFAPAACYPSSNTCRNNNEIKMVYCCMMYLSKTRSFSKGRDLAAWRLSKPALQQAAHHQTLWSWLLGSLLAIIVLGGGEMARMGWWIISFSHKSPEQRLNLSRS